MKLKPWDWIIVGVGFLGTAAWLAWWRFWR